jgi:hypothetical protein
MDLQFWRIILATHEGVVLDSDKVLIKPKELLL